MTGLKSGVITSRSIFPFYSSVPRCDELELWGRMEGMNFMLIFGCMYDRLRFSFIIYQSSAIPLRSRAYFPFVYYVVFMLNLSWLIFSRGNGRVVTVK